MTLQDAQRQMLEFVEARDWQRFHRPKNLVMALTGEVGELNELFQWRTDEESDAIMDDPELAQQVRDEMADVFSYLLSLASALDVDLLTAFKDKMIRVEQRYVADEVRGQMVKR
ncbi:nucleotide pyrophosphohydrolase [Pseudonocardiaceae bacterium YIM PH 21723]|nr:nucleotide pyrophosphohydrolase [Pseudonocardiaceae bacterium YIM PH 21723]